MKDRVVFCTGYGEPSNERILESSDYKVIAFNKYVLFGWASE